jgi:hypothetical protein
MFRKTLIALAATAALAGGVAATTASAEAKTIINVGLGFGGFGGYGYGGYYGGYYGGGYCGPHWVTHKVWNWNHTYKIWVTQKVYSCF